jgi:hypothetical protein
MGEEYHSSVRDLEAENPSSARDLKQQIHVYYEI